MIPGELESLRTEGEQHGLSRRETLTLLEHLDAVADQRNVAMSRLFDSEKARNEITADRDEARQEVAALRAQRDEIREVHRVETAALAARLEAAERERGELRAEVVTLRADLEEWRRSHREAESLADQAKRRRERTLETVEARADAAEAKLAALVKAATAVCEWDPARLEGNLYAEGLVADLGSLRNATKAARGTP